MAIHMTGTEALLDWNWTFAAVTEQIDKLIISLEQLEVEKGKKVQIDCGLVSEADASGLQLLMIWLECARMRGVEPVLVNISVRLQQIMKFHNFWQYLAENICISTLATEQ